MAWRADCADFTLPRRHRQLPIRRPGNLVSRRRRCALAALIRVRLVGQAEKDRVGLGLDILQERRRRDRDVLGQGQALSRRQNLWRERPRALGREENLLVAWHQNGEPWLINPGARRDDLRLHVRLLMR